jgi:hypothetical protein
MLAIRIGSQISPSIPLPRSSEAREISKCYFSQIAQQKNDVREV